MERFHQTLKKEEVFYHLYDNPGACRDHLEAYRDVYNTIRPHWALKPQQGGDVLTPDDVYRQGMPTQIPKWQTWARAAKKKLDQKLNNNEEEAMAA